MEGIMKTSTLVPPPVSTTPTTAIPTGFTTGPPDVDKRSFVDDIVYVIWIVLYDLILLTIVLIKLVIIAYCSQFYALLWTTLCQKLRNQNPLAISRSEELELVTNNRRYRNYSACIRLETPYNEPTNAERRASSSSPTACESVAMLLLSKPGLNENLSKANSPKIKGGKLVEHDVPEN